MSYFFAIQGADNEIYAVECHNISDNAGDDRNIDSNTISEYLNEEYGTVEKATELVNNGEIEYITFHYFTRRDFKHVLYISSLEYTEPDFEKRNIIYLDDIGELISYVKSKSGTIFLWNDNIDSWITI